MKVEKLDDSKNVCERLLGTLSQTSRKISLPKKHQSDS